MEIISLEFEIIGYARFRFSKREHNRGYGGRLGNYVLYRLGFVNPRNFKLGNNNQCSPISVFEADVTRDNVNLTPSQLDRWHVLYEGVPEAALNPSVAYYFNDDTLQQGKMLTLASAVENIGDYPIDSL